MRSFIATALAAAALASSPAAAKEKLEPEARLAKMLEGRVAGEPRSCIPMSTVNNSTIIDGTAIVYRSGGTLWVNRPRGGAESLDDDDILVTKLTTNQLCSIDTVELRDRASGFYSGFVSLGDFIPYRKVDTAAVK
ncbi:MAG: hypothetical protein U0S50_10220 [Sphingopyxis sp.]|uniref:hypothetical protein n=1 Tax=Sphingopyxis sp. TaxID=1908224 RepID=UPI002ABA9F6E|nr:hypothetical protein [Sphingopyxis sp.]MDZ3832180.1 hypothetical protein [Sphingopyxis sp.]